MCHFFCQQKNDDLTPLAEPEWDLFTTINPAGVNPLCAKLNISATVAGKVRIEVVGQDGEQSNIVHTFEGTAKEQSVPILGLYPDYHNIVQVSLLNESGIELLSEELQITTSGIPDLFTQIDVDIRKPDKMESGLTLVSYRGISNPHTPFMIDAFGKIRWILDYSNHPSINELYYDVGMERLQNGNFYFGESRTDAIYEIDVYGEIVNAWTLSPYGFHHNVQEKPDGNFLVTARPYNSVHLNGALTKDDQIIEIDRQSGSIVNTWDLKESLDENRVVGDVDLNTNTIDWAHANAVIFDESDNTIIVSCQKQGVVKLDSDNNVVWILSSHLAWGANRRGDDLNDYLLTPLDAASNPITDVDILNGYENHPDFEWNWYQHAPLLMPNGNIMLFDNGYIRNHNGVERYSRAVEYDINETQRTVRQIWHYGKERGTAAYSLIVSDVDYLSQTNHVLFSPGYRVSNGNGTKGGKIIELDYLSKEVVFEVRLTGASNMQFHRAERLSLYP